MVQLSPRRTTGFLAACGPIFAVSLRGSLTGRRWLAVAAIDVLYIVLALVIGLASTGSRVQGTIDLFHFLALPVLMPFIALLFATEALGAEVEDRTLIYLTLRPVSSLAIAASKFAAALLITTIAVWVALLGGYLVLARASGPTTLPIALFGAGLIGSMAYVGGFALLGLLLRRALLFGSLYILLWEGAIAGISTTAAHLSVRFYTLGGFGLLLNRSDLLSASDEGPASLGSLIALLGFAGVALLWTARQIRRVELR